MLPKNKLVLLIFLLLAAGCGKKGAPMPPEPKGPLPPGQVNARQVGGRIEVSFSVPEPFKATTPFGSFEILLEIVPVPVMAELLVSIPPPERVDSCNVIGASLTEVPPMLSVPFETSIGPLFVKPPVTVKPPFVMLVVPVLVTPVLTVAVASSMSNSLLLVSEP